MVQCQFPPLQNHDECNLILIDLVHTQHIFSQLKLSRPLIFFNLIDHLQKVNERVSSIIYCWIYLQHWRWFCKSHLWKIVDYVILLHYVQDAPTYYQWQLSNIDVIIFIFARLAMIFQFSLILVWLVGLYQQIDMLHLLLATFYSTNA